MPFCSFAHNVGAEYTLIDNAFMTHFLPYAPESALKVYLYGLSLCQNPLCERNDPDYMAMQLDYTAEDILSAFLYWEEMGLVRILSRNPLTVNYLSPSQAMEPSHLIPKDRYGDFLVQLQDCFPDRLLSSNELYTYLRFLEETHFDPQAMVLIAKFCTDKKGTNIKSPYVLTVARNWMEQGVVTMADVEARIAESDNVSEELRAVFHTLKKTAKPDIGDRQLYVKWTRSWGFAPDAVLCAAKTVKRGGMDKLDAVLDGYFRSGIFTVEDITAAIKTREQTFALCVKINKILGLYYESLEHIVETYITPWLTMGYTEESLVLLAKYCAMRSIRTLEGMQDIVQQLYAQGVVEEQSVKVYLDEYANVEKAIMRVLDATGSARRVTQNDRDMYKTWKQTWGFDDSLILYAAQCAQGKPYPMGIVGNTLSRWYASGVNTLEQARGMSAAAVAATPVATAGAEFRRAEIRASLKEDATYRKLDQTVRSLRMQMAHCQLENRPVPPQLQAQSDEAEEQLAKRIRDLGYDPNDVQDI